MNERTKAGIGILSAALVLGVVADMLLRAFPWGINAALWTGALLAVLIAPRRWKREAWQGGGYWLLLPMMLFSAAFTWRDSPALKVMNALALLVAFSLLMLRAQGGRIRLAGIADYVLGSLIASFNATFGLLPLLFSDIEWKGLASNRSAERLVAVGRGLLLTFPLLLIFGGLFMAADAVFQGILENLLQLDLARLFTHLLVTGFFAWVVAGFLRGMLLGKEKSLVDNSRVAAPSLGITEIAVALGLIDVLFLSFVVVQLRYLFGGASLVGITKGLTYAEYARRGFFELVIVAALVLPLLLATHWVLRKDNPANECIFRLLAGAMLALLFVIMASAVQRMRLYQAEYGLTESRLYATAFMVWLAVVFVWFAITALVGRRERFAFGAMVAGFLLIATLHLLNPDALIVRANTTRTIEGRRFDVRYAGSLSADAVPALVTALPALSPPDRAALADGLLKRWSTPEQQDWRSWSWARAKAWQVAEENSALLRATRRRQGIE